MKLLHNVHILKVDPDVGITTEHIRGLAESYEKSGVRAPVVIGHPKDNSPAWGWVLSCRGDDTDLYCDITVSPEFYELMEQGRFRERSVAFFNKKPYVLRHLGFLGATPPAIKGLQELTFSDDDDYKCIAMTMDEIKNSDLTQYLAPVALFALSEVLPGVKASNLTQDPVYEGGKLSGIVELANGTRYNYTIVESNGEWTATTDCINPEVVTLAEEVADLKKQILVNKNTAKVEKLYGENKLTEAILPKDDCMALLTCSESAIAWKLFNNLPPLVEDTPGPSNDVTLSENEPDLHLQILAKASELKLNPNNPKEYTEAFKALT